MNKKTLIKVLMICVDKSGKEVIPSTYDYLYMVDGIFKVKEDKKWGYLDKNGLVIVPIIYDEIEYFEDGVAIAEKNGNYGCVSIRGREVIPFIYEYLNTFNGVVKAKKNDKWGFLDMTGQEIIPFIYEEETSFFYKGIAKAKKNEKWGYIDLAGKEVIPIKYDYIESCNIDLDIIKYNDQQGIFDVSTIYRTTTIAKPITSMVMANGLQKSLKAYTIEGSTYYKLRDLAQLLNGTEKQFDITWDQDKKAIRLKQNQPYIGINDNHDFKNTKNVIALYNTSELLINEKTYNLNSFIVGGNNYVNLIDMGEMLNYDVYWNGNNDRLEINTSNDYFTRYVSQP